MRFVTLSLLAAACLLACRAGIDAGACAAGRTMLDGVCVDDKVADYVGCVRAQGAKLDSQASERLSAEAAYAGARAEVASDVSRQLAKTYSASDANVQAIIQACRELQTTRTALAAEDVCARARDRLVSCGVEAEAYWSDCPNWPTFTACARSAGEDCNALANCAFRNFGALHCNGAGTPSGGVSCSATTQCQAACGTANAPASCFCDCNAQMNPAVALGVLASNSCYGKHCNGTCGAPGAPACAECYVRHCGAVHARLCEH